MDDRCELYGDGWIRAYADTLGKPPEELGPEFEQLADEWGFRRALVMTEPPARLVPLSGRNPNIDS